MSSQVVDKLVMELELELNRFRSQSQEAERLNDKLKKSLGDAESAGKKAASATDDLGESTHKAGKEAEATAVSFLAATRRLTGLFAVITGSFAFERLISSVARVNDELNFMQQRLGMSARNIKLMGNAANMLGGDANAMQNSMKGLNQSIQQLVLMGDASALPFFNALGVGVVDAQGKIRAMDDIMLDMAESFSRMDRQQGYALASAMGLDDDTANVMMQGRQAMQDMIDMQATLHTSTQAELNASRQLRQQQAYLSANWDGLKTILGNALVPFMAKLTEGAIRFVEYLTRNERTVKNVFEGIAYVVGALTVVAFGKATVAAIALLAPFGKVMAIVGTLAAAFLLLYDDYKTWSEGGESLFDWDGFISYISNAELSVDSLKSAFARLLTGYSSWSEAASAFGEWARLKGFIEENGITVDSLAQGFKNLASDILNSIPVLRTFASIISKLLSGDFKGAFDEAMTLPVSAAQTIGGGMGWMGERVSGAIDTALGYGSDAAGTLSSGFRNIKSTVGGWFNRGVGVLPESMRPSDGNDIESMPQEESSRLGVPYPILKSTVGGWFNRGVGVLPESMRPSGGNDIESMLQEESSRLGVPYPILKSIWIQETGGRQEFIDDPAKYHYGLNAEGRRVAPHTGQISTAFGPFGILESTARDPGYGVQPLRDKSLREQVRFFSEYFAARASRSGSWRSGLAGYGEGDPYADAVLNRARSFGYDDSVGARSFSRGASISGGAAGAAAGAHNEINVNLGGVTVHTSAATLPAITSEALGAAVDKSANSLNQLASGL